MSIVIKPATLSTEITVSKALKKFDVNNNGILDRCEDAIGLNTLGFSEEYALKYSHNLAVSAAKARCDQVFNPLFGQ